MATAGGDGGTRAPANCELCRGDGGTPIVRTPELRVVRVEDPDHPGYARVIWNAHVSEMSDLDASQRQRLMAAVNAVESALRQVLAPDKINLASLGNVVPHLHWHVIARYAGDPHFPQPVWAARRRDADPASLARLRERLPALEEAIRRHLCAG
jgi:diadenosine tetraphosphate (Ap4A) HIT family hydrolase